MGLLELCLLTMLAPQQPAPPTAAATVDPATWLPAEVLAAVVCHAPDGDAATGGFWTRLGELAPAAVTAGIEGELRRKLKRAGLEPEDLADLQRGGVAVALLGFGSQGKPRFAAVARAASRATQLQQAFARLAAAGSARPATVAGKPCSRFQFDGLDVYGGAFDGHFVFASDAATMAELLARTQKATEACLAATPDWLAAAAAADCGKAPAVTVFVRPARLVAQAGALLPAEVRPQVDRAGEALQLRELDHAMLRIDCEGGALRCAATCPLPAPGSLFAALLGDPTRLTAALAAAVPPAAREFSFSTVDLGAVVDAAIALAREIEPQAGAAIDAQLAAVGKTAGVDLRADLLGGWTGQIVAVRFAEGFGVSLGLRDAPRFQRCVTALRKAADDPFTEFTVADAPALRLDPAAGAPLTLCLATTGGWLCVADGEANLAALVRQHRQPVADPDAAAALAAAPAGASLLQQRRDGGERATVIRASQRVVMRSETDFAAALAAALARTTTSSPAPAQDTKVAAPTAPAADVETLRAAERQPETADLAGLEQLASSPNAAVAARAAWLLAVQKRPEAIAALERIATAGPHPEARLQAMHGLFRGRSVTSVSAAIDGLDDEDRRVRTIAAQVLGKLRRPASKAPLLALLGRRQEGAAATEPATDVVEALLALGDMEAVDQLLPAATAIAASQPVGAGQALTYVFQTLSPRLPHEDEVTLLLAVLDHREPLLRRYAIQRLGMLAEPTTAKALEGRLAGEGDELRPLVEVALANVRRQQHASPTADEAGTEGLVARLQRRWQGLPDQQQYLLLGLGGAAVLMVVVLAAFVARRRRTTAAAATAAASAALAEPSAEYVEQLSAEAQQLAGAADALIDATGEPDAAPDHAPAPDEDLAALADAGDAAGPGEEPPTDEVVLSDDVEQRA